MEILTVMFVLFSEWGGSSPASLPLPFLGWSWCTIHTGPRAVLCPDIPRDAVRVPWCCCSPLQVSFQKQTVLGNASSRYSGALLHGNGKTPPKDWAIQQEFEFGILSIVMEQIKKHLCILLLRSTRNQWMILKVCKMSKHGLEWNVSMDKPDNVKQIWSEELPEIECSSQNEINICILEKRHFSIVPKSLPCVGL